MPSREEANKYPKEYLQSYKHPSRAHGQERLDTEFAEEERGLGVSEEKEKEDRVPKD